MRRIVVVIGCALSAPAIAGPGPSYSVSRLLVAPTFAHPARGFVALAGVGASVQVAWRPVAGAARYRATWTDPAGHAADAELAAPRFERTGVAPGHYVLAVAAIDAAGISGGMTTLPIEVVELHATPPGDDAPAAPTRGAYAVGSRLAIAGMRCALGDGPPSAEVRATVPGAPLLRCIADAGAYVETHVVIAPVVVASRTVPLARGKTTQVHVTVASVAELGDGLDVDAIGDAKIGDPQRTELGLDVAVTPTTDAHAAALSIQAGGLELGRVELPLVDAAAPPAVVGAATQPAWFALDLGGHVGGFLPRANGPHATVIGRPTDPNDATTAGALVGPLVGLFPTRAVGIEVEVSFIGGGYADGTGSSPLLATRAQLAVRAVDSGKLGLRLLAGAGALTALANRGTAQAGTIGEAHAGLAITFETQGVLWLRLQLVDVVTTARDEGFAHAAEVELGVVTRLGRRDR